MNIVNQAEQKKKLILNVGYENPLKSKTDCLNGEIINTKYQYSESGDCRLVLFYKNGKKLEIQANDLGFEIYQLNK